VVAFTLLYAYLTMTRLRLAELEEGRERRALEEAIAERVAADRDALKDRTERAEPAVTG
jgi:hypothetical protein